MELENLASKKRYVFRCGRWLATNEDDGSIVREMAAEGDDIKKPQPGDVFIIIVFFFFFLFFSGVPQGRGHNILFRGL